MPAPTGGAVRRNMPAPVLPDAVRRHLHPARTSGDPRAAPGRLEQGRTAATSSIARGFSFPTGYYEDTPWTTRLCFTARSHRHASRRCVHYRQRRHGNILGTRLASTSSLRPVGAGLRLSRRATRARRMAHSHRPSGWRSTTSPCCAIPAGSRPQTGRTSSGAACAQLRRFGPGAIRPPARGSRPHCTPASIRAGTSAASTRRGRVQRKTSRVQGPQGLPRCKRRKRRAASGQEGR